MRSFVIAVALATQSSPDLDSLCLRVVDDDSLMKSISESAAQPSICMSHILRTQGLTVALGKEASKRCGFDAEVDKAAVAIKARFPDVSNSLAKTAASKCVGWMLLHASVEDASRSK